MSEAAPFQAVALDPDVLALAARTGTSLLAADDLTTLHSLVFERPAHRLRLGDGRTLKARVFSDTAEAERFCALHAWLPERGFPRLLDAVGRAVLLEWIPGERFPAAPGEPLLRRSGRLLGRLHRIALPDGAGWRLASPADGLPRSLEPELAVIVDAGRLETREAARLLELSEAARPENPQRGLLHLDLCPDNLVVDAAGEPVSIDNATLTCGPIDHDLGRVWYRWSMTPAQRAAFLAGYREQRDTAAFQAAFSYWRIAGLVFSAWLRVHRRTGDAAEPVADLRRLLPVLENLGTPVPGDPDRLARLP